MVLIIQGRRLSRRLQRYAAFREGLEASSSQQSDHQAGFCDLTLAFPPGETCQFDWSHETAVIGVVEQTIKVAHFRLSYSRQMFVIAYPRETQEMVLDAIFVGKERRFNRRFLTLANHYLFELVACTPESGWGKGQVENQVGNIREWLFTPTSKFADFTGGGWRGAVRN